MVAASVAFEKKIKIKLGLACAKFYHDYMVAGVSVIASYPQYITTCVASV